MQFRAGSTGVQIAGAGFHSWLQAVATCLQEYGAELASSDTLTWYDRTEC